MTGAEPDRNSLPRMTISMLGASKSGKSSYILGMFAALVRGQPRHQYSLSTENHGVGIAMLQELDDLQKGNPPRATDEPKMHKFTLLGGLPGDGRPGGAQMGIAALDLTDFRGGAMREVPVEDNDTARYYRQLLLSDSIFVVLDSSHFREPVTPCRAHAVAQATWANRIGDLVGWAIKERRQAGLTPPSIVVLLAKWDFLDDRKGTRARGLGEVYDDVHALLPKLFGTGIEQYVFGVSIGQFSDEDGKPRQASIDLSGVEKPLFFASGCFLAQEAERLNNQRERIITDRSVIAAKLAALTKWPPLIQWFLRTSIDRRQAELAAKETEIATLDFWTLQVTEHGHLLRSLATLWRIRQPQAGPP